MKSALVGSPPKHPTAFLGFKIMKLFIIDTETSALEPSQGATILELAWIAISNDDGIWKPVSHSTMYIQYDGPINPHAQASHHIRTDQLTPESGAFPREQAIEWLLKQIESDSILVAHNVAFDSKFLPELKRPWICTMKSAKHVWPDAPGYGNQVLRYWLGIKIPQSIIELAPIIMHMNPHQALFDVAITTGILSRMIDHGYSPDQLLHMTRTPLTLKKIPFGKHKGRNFNQVPRDYLNWLRNQSDLDEDVKHTVETILRS